MPAAQSLASPHERCAGDIAQVGAQDGVPVVECGAVELPEAAVLGLQPLESRLPLRAVSHQVELLACMKHVESGPG